MVRKKYTVTSFSMDEETEEGRDLIQENEGSFAKWLSIQVKEYKRKYERNN